MKAKAASEEAAAQVEKLDAEIAKAEKDLDQIKVKRAIADNTATDVILRSFQDLFVAGLPDEVRKQDVWKSRVAGMEETMAALGREMVEAAAQREAQEKSDAVKGAEGKEKDEDDEEMDIDAAEEQQDQSLQHLIAEQEKLGTELEAIAEGNAPLSKEQAEEARKRARDLLPDMKARTADLSSMRKVRRTLGKGKGALKIGGAGGPAKPIDDA